MDDALLVGVRYRLTHLEKEPEPVGDGEGVRVGELVDRLPVDVVHREVGEVVGSAAAVEQPGDVGMVQRGQDLALRPEARENMVRIHASLDQFDRDSLVEPAVRPLGQVDGAHSTPAQLADQAVRTDPPSDDRLLAFRTRECDRRRLDEAPRPLVRDEQPLDLGAERRVLAALPIEQRRPCIRGKRQGGMEERLEPLPAVSAHAPSFPSMAS